MSSASHVGRRDAKGGARRASELGLVRFANCLSRLGTGPDCDAAAADGDAAPAAVADFLPGEEDAMASLQSLIQVHRMPPIILGSGRTSLADKFVATVHAIWLESGSASAAIQWCGEVSTITSDLGAESGLASIVPMDLASILPWAPLTPQEHGPEQPPDDDDFGDTAVSLQDSLSCPGLMHILHNASNSLLDVMPELDAAIDALSHVANLLRTPATCKRLLSTCFSCAAGKLHHRKLQAFDGHVHRSRWGTIAYCVEHILRVRWVLCWGWSVDAYAQAGQDLVTKKARVEVAEVEKAISSEFWWGCMQALDLLLICVRASMAWCEGCPCHHEALLNEDLPMKLVRAMLSCPMRGRRLPELAAGDFANNLGTLLNIGGADLLLQLPRGSVKT